ncbi:hypothetical protein HID58_022158 [Brassica napus]|uniref:Uncharacterized protein n=1 Tax=Brassica napus TaxID=3708 RepID=A0ABQ8CYF6_BRANA|nr:hypothetical protein HID58_022158 [Brassica napus]
MNAANFVVASDGFQGYVLFDGSVPALSLLVMARRQVGSTRRLGDGGSFPFAGALHSKSRSSPLLSICLVLVGACLLIGYAYSGPGIFKSIKEVSKVTDETEAWGIEPYDIEDADSHCKSLVSKGLVRVADIKFPLPYRPKSFSLVIVSDALDYLSPKYLNKTVPELARVASDGVVLFAGLPGQQRAKVAELSKFGRPAKMRSASWWNRFFVQTSLEENEAPSKKFEQAVSKGSYKPACQVFHLKPLH